MRLKTIQLTAIAFPCAVCLCIGGCFVSEKVRFYASDADVPNEVLRGLEIPASSNVVVSSRTEKDSFTVNFRMSTSQKVANDFINDRRKQLSDGVLTEWVSFDKVSGIDFPTVVPIGPNSLRLEKNDRALGHNHLEQWYFDATNSRLYGCVSEVR